LSCENSWFQSEFTLGRRVTSHLTRGNAIKTQVRPIAGKDMLGTR
jgi:hypothetical protein